MAPPRRSTRSTAAQNQGSTQSTLSFRATKAGALRPGTKDTLEAKTPASKKPRLSEVQPDDDHNVEIKAEPSSNIKIKAADDDSHDAEPQAKARRTRGPETETKPTTQTEDATQVQLKHESIPEIKTEDVVTNQPEEEEEEEEEDEALVQQYEKARKLPATAIQRYWSAKQNQRRAPRVHQHKLSTHERLLREWDVTSRWGPSVGLSREARWRRAFQLELDPPLEVLAVLLKASGHEDSKGKAAAAPMQVSIIDELLASTGRDEIVAQG